MQTHISILSTEKNYHQGTIEKISGIETAFSSSIFKRPFSCLEIFTLLIIPSRQWLVGFPRCGWFLIARMG